MAKIENLEDLRLACKEYVGCIMLRIGMERYLHPFSPESKNLKELVFEAVPGVRKHPAAVYKLSPDITLRDVVLECAKQGIFFNSPLNQERVEEWLKTPGLREMYDEEGNLTKLSATVSKKKAKVVARKSIGEISSQEEYIRALEENFPAPEVLDDFLEGAGASSISDAVRNLIDGVASGKIKVLSAGELDCIWLEDLPLEKVARLLFGFTLQERSEEEGWEIYLSPSGEKWRFSQVWGDDLSLEKMLD